MDDRSRRLDALRAEQQRIDEKIVADVAARVRTATEVRRLLKGAASLDVDERGWIDGLVETLRPAGGEPSVAGAPLEPTETEAVREVLSRMRAATRGLEQPSHVAYVGGAGGFCHGAARSHFAGEAVLTSHDTAAEAFDAVARGRAVYAVFPLESSVEGLVQPSIQALSHSELVMVAERVLPAAYRVLQADADDEGAPAEIQRIYTTAPAHAACEQYLRKHHGGVPVVDVRSPEEALADALADAVGGALVPSVGDVPGTRVVTDNVGDVADRQVRYGIAAARPAMRSGRDRTNLLFRVEDEPGALFEMIRPFAERGVNLRQLQSRPVAGPGWEYVYYAELEGHESDRSMVAAIGEIRRQTTYLRVLGSFPAG